MKSPGSSNGPPSRRSLGMYIFVATWRSGTTTSVMASGTRLLVGFLPGVETVVYPMCRQLRKWSFMSVVAAQVRSTMSGR